MSKPFQTKCPSGICELMNQRILGIETLSLKIVLFPIEVYILPRSRTLYIYYLWNKFFRWFFSITEFFTNLSIHHNSHQHYFKLIQKENSKYLPLRFIINYVTYKIQNLRIRAMKFKHFISLYQSLFSANLSIG